MSESVKSYKRDAIKAARQLKYSDYILARIKQRHNGKRDLPTDDRRQTHKTVLLNAL